MLAGFSNGFSGLPNDLCESDGSGECTGLESSSSRGTPSSDSCVRTARWEPKPEDGRGPFRPDHSKLALRVTSPTMDPDEVLEAVSRAAFLR